MIFSIFLYNFHLSSNQSILQESINASSDFLFTTSFQALATKSCKSVYFHSFLQDFIASIGQSQIHFIAFNQNLIVLSSI